MTEPTPAPPPPPADESDAPSGFGAGWAERNTIELEEDALVGSVLNDTYRIGRVIGEGGMGRVYEAWHTRISKKRYAIKVLHAEFARNDGILKRFQREAETAACISHPNAVGVYDVGVTTDSRPFLVSEYLEGSDLAHRIKQQAPLPTAFVKYIGLQICGALVEAHSRGVVHRDLKPQNIFLLAGPDGEIPDQPIAKVLDFGLSRFLDDADSELTRSGMVMGTPSYMSPEQARGERADHRVDVYGLGAILYACVVGKPPFKSSSPQATVLAVMNEEAPRPSKLNPDVSPELELIIQKAMAREPSRRYATMSELRLELEGLPEDDAHSRARPRLDSFGTRIDGGSLRSRLLGYWALGTVLCLVAAAAALCGAVFLRYGSWPISAGASGLLALVVLAAFAAPVVSALRGVMYRVWDNTPRVAEALRATRRIVTVGSLAFATTVGSLLLVNSAGAMFARLDVLRETALSTTAGIGLVGFVAMGLGALAAGFQEHLLAPGGWVDRAQTAAQVRRRRVISGPVVVAGVGLLVSSSVVAVHRWSVASVDADTVRVDEASSVEGGATPGTVAPTAANPPPASSSTSTTDVPFAAVPEPKAIPSPLLVVPDAGVTGEAEGMAEASNDALTAAISQGSDALERLVTQYPNDPQALRALAMDHASKASGLEKAIDAFRRLFAVSPQAIRDNDLQQIILSIARSHGPAMQKAFVLMAYDMGPVGPDLLYKLSLSDRERRVEARAYLGKEKVHEKFSPALSIAYELQFSPTCASRLPLLPRAAQFGDERSLVVLAALSAAPKTGCGKRKQQPCRPKCPDEASQFDTTVRAIAERMQRSPGPATSASE